MSGSIPFLPFLLDPVRVALESMAGGLFQKAQASSLGIKQTPRRHIYIALPSAPPRWYFDLALSPYTNGDELGRNNMLNTRFADIAGLNQAGAPVYATTPIQIGNRTINMPYLWKSDIPTSDGNWVPMSQLLEHMMIIRGINMLADGHETNAIKQTAPLNSSPSLGGAAADLSPHPIPALNLTGARVDGYRSGKGIGQVVVRTNDTVNPLEQLLGAFDNRSDNISSSYLSRRVAMEQAIQTGLKTLCQYAETSIPGSQTLCDTRIQAEKMLRTGIGNLASEYQVLKEKYKLLMKRCLDVSHPVLGVTDKPVRVQDYNRDQRVISGSGGFDFVANNADLRSIFRVEATQVTSLAESFAVIEYVIARGYSTAVMCGIGNVTGLNFEVGNYSSSVTTTPAARSTWETDEHFAGSALSLMINSFKFRALAACLFELIRVLTADGTFDETVIQIGSEFTRSPRNDQNGSDHGWRGNLMSILSGSIREPSIVGNTRAINPPEISNNDQHFGSWGVAALMNLEGTRAELSIGHATSTVAELLRVKPPVINNHPLIVENNGRVTLTVEEAKNVNGS
jgi:hypothetical protein